ncbi:pyridoxal-phosphate dependent enzyme [Micromonospora sonneratiae]|uniref:Cysteine synthase family protein n=1 Tax=Micromonospora sonneratiae TaxID=1184706 RepID=A0ABW3YLI1_9ACTN
MSRTQAYRDVVEAQRLPRLIRLGPNYYAAVFTLMKLLPAWYILRSAADRGELGPDTVVVETTSGTFGLGLAQQTALTGHRLILVGDPAIDDRLRRRLETLGAEVQIVQQPAPVGGIQAARLERVREIRERHPDSFCPNQYGNPDNPLSYSYAAAAIAEAVGQVDCLVGPVGSGGSMCGTATHLRTAFDDMRAVGIDTHNSVLFGQPDGRRALRGLGNSLLPPNLDHRVFDEVHWLGPAEAYAGARELLARHALFMGPTSGAAYVVGRWWAAEHPDATTVILCPDEGYRYQDTVFDPDWIAAQGLDRPGPPEPTPVFHPAEVDTGWTYLGWNRRGLDEVVRQPATRG